MADGDEEKKDLLVGSDVDSDFNERGESGRETESYISDGGRRIRTSKVPWGTLLLEKCGLCNCCALSR